MIFEQNNKIKFIHFGKPDRKNSLHMYIKKQQIQHNSKEPFVPIEFDTATLS